MVCSRFLTLLLDDLLYFETICHSLDQFSSLMWPFEPLFFLSRSYNVHVSRAAVALLMNPTMLLLVSVRLWDVLDYSVLENNCVRVAVSCLEIIFTHMGGVALVANVYPCLRLPFSHIIPSSCGRFQVVGWR